MKKKITEEKTVNPKDAEKKDWQKVEQEALQISSIAKCLWLVMIGEDNGPGEILNNVEIGTVVDQIRTGLDEIYKIASDHI
jgi:hypothetical protein